MLIILRKSIISICVGIVLFQSQASTYAETNTIVPTQETQTFSIKTGSNRLIYDTDTTGVTLTVSNPQDYPILVQANVVDEDKKSKANFIVTPPIFRLAGHQQNRVKVVNISKDEKSNKESLKWLCLSAIPPEKDSTWAQGYQKNNTPKLLIQMRVTSCIKMMVRPSSLKGTPVDYANELSWYKNAYSIIVKNPTPFYINFKDIQLGSVIINAPDYIPPMGSITLKSPSNYSGVVKYKLITDFGGESKEFQAKVE